MTALLLPLLLAAAPGCPGALARAAAERDPASLARSAPAIAGALEERGAGGPTGAVRRAALDAALAADEGGAAADRAGAAFRQTLEAHCALSAAPRLPGASAADRAALEAVLARPEFRRARIDPTALRRALLAAWAAVLELLGSTEAERYASLGRGVFLMAAAAAALLGVATLRRRARRIRGAPIPEAAARLLSAPDASASRAEEALARDDRPGAVRHAFLAALAALEAAGRLPIGRALTNAEMVRWLARPAAQAALAAEVSALAGTFDRTVYGARPVEREEAVSSLARARRIGELARGAAA
ncbi:MAG TPA: DUF4129 domain-containing protein [Anaeromyxobacteraceae bacterium]|nr:DUF4129 domain-containing protein [Anaeromyxobacteraceae bacterium]